MWLRLNSETIKNYCSKGYTEAWCLGYNQHLGKSFLVPIDEPKSILDQVRKEVSLRKRLESSEE